MIFIERNFFKTMSFCLPSVEASDSDTEGGAPVSIMEASASGMSCINHPLRYSRGGP